jgi:hypothetical protein
VQMVVGCVMLESECFSAYNCKHLERVVIIFVVIIIIILAEDKLKFRFSLAQTVIIPTL